MEAYILAEEAKSRLNAAFEAARYMEIMMAGKYFTPAMVAKTSAASELPKVVRWSSHTTELSPVTSVPVTVAPIVSSNTIMSYMEQELNKVKQMEADFEGTKTLATLSQNVMLSPKKGNPALPDPEWPVVPLYPATTGDKLPTGWSVTNTDTEGVTVTLKMGTAEGLMGFIVIMGMGKSFAFYL